MSTPSFWRLSGALSLCLLVAACETAPISTPTVSPTDPASLRLAAAAEKAASALDAISRVEQVRGPDAPPDDFTGAPEELMEPVTLSWTGPMEPIVQMMALRAGYAFMVQGKAPPVPIVITLDVFDKPLLKVVRDIGLQAGERADIIVNPALKQMDLRYVADDAADVR